MKQLILPVLLAAGVYVLPAGGEKSSAPMLRMRPQTYPAALLAKSDSVAMRLVSAGPFISGSEAADLERLPAAKQRAFFKTEAQPAARQRAGTGDFYIDIHEVTNAQYAKFLQATGHRQPAFWNDRLLRQPRYPVVGIGWEDARAYAAWAGKRLPTEWEWEKAARGTDGRRWPWGNQFGVGNCNSEEIGLGTIAAVGTYTGVSPYGLFDMAGNVWEMCEGQWSDGRRSGPVMRGGCFNNDRFGVRTSVRWSPRSEAQIQNGTSWLGFRCVMDAGKVQVGVNAEIVE